MNSLHRAKEEFLKYLDGIRGYSALTIRSYNDSIDEMLEYAQIEAEGNEIRINLMPFRIHIAGLSAKTISRKLSAIRSFAKYMAKQEKEVRLWGDDSIKTPKTLPKPISHEHIVHVLEHAGFTERVIITLLYTMGLRISELAHLQIDDISAQWCRITGKGNKQRDVPLLPQVYVMICQYLEHSRPNKYVFERGGEKLSENSLRYSITKAFAATGLKVTPHQLRHAYATELLNNRARIADVSQLLGHASMATTQIYTKLGNALKMDHYRQSHPLCQSTEDHQ